MTYPHESIDLPEDRGCLRWVLGVPLTLIHLLNAFFVYSAVAFSPQGDWDDQGYAGLGAVCLASVALSVLGVLITLIPSVRRAMGLWWFAPPVVLAVIAIIRVKTA
ncbi:hypothetical protein [Streptomyces bambusae]|uniref:Uncharacterized protein n=1 Tax=Streptomyces bambusae TaxID=1550616 RepID=A0ABS6Z0G2_9ACTN|nr:hypothetical protein [Streptomyces bambusae]MBW5481234.1 hypothetical protein [Streptomyces bambusae]